MLLPLQLRHFVNNLFGCRSVFFNRRLRFILYFEIVQIVAFLVFLIVVKLFLRVFLHFDIIFLLICLFLFRSKFFQVGRNGKIKCKAELSDKLVNLLIRLSDYIFKY